MPTLWSPDTCDCIIDIEGDWDAPQSVVSVKKCPAHAALDGIAHLNVVWKGECQLKNYTFAMAQQLKPSLTVDDYTWYFDSNRKLHVGFLGKLSASERAQLRQLADGRFGAGKVEVA